MASIFLRKSGDFNDSASAVFNRATTAIRQPGRAHQHEPAALGAVVLVVTTSYQVVLREDGGQRLHPWRARLSAPFLQAEVTKRLRKSKQ